jgi:hypothetical protein
MPQASRGVLEGPERFLIGQNGFPICHTNRYKINNSLVATEPNWDPGRMPHARFNCRASAPLAEEKR